MRQDNGALVMHDRAQLNNVQVAKNFCRTLRNGIAGHYNYRLCKLNTTDYFNELGRGVPNWIPNDAVPSYRIYICDNAGPWDTNGSDSRIIRSTAGYLRNFLFLFLRDLTRGPAPLRDIFGGRV